MPWEKSLIFLILAATLKFGVFIYLGFYVAFNTVQVISRWVVGRAEETSTYSTYSPTSGKQLPAFPLEAVAPEVWRRTKVSHFRMAEFSICYIIPCPI